MEKKNAKKILISIYKNRRPSEVKLLFERKHELLKNEGYIFDYPAYESHEQALNRLKEILPKIDSKDVTNAFLYSLSTRKLEYRSILGSYYYAKAIPEHEIELSHNKILREYNDRCYLCGWFPWRKDPKEYDMPHGLNYYNYERYGVGGGAFFHTSLNSVLFDLEQFIKLPKVNPSEEDVEIINKILECVSKMDGQGKAGKLRDIIHKEKIFKCNKEEIAVLLNALGICGILASKEFPSYEDKFVDEYMRDSVEYRNDFAYPLNRWKASDGINVEKFKKVFNFDFE